MALTSQQLATKRLLEWLKIYQPEFYMNLPLSVTDPTQNGLGDWTSIISAITNAAIQYDNNKTARKQIELNIARAQTGQDPVTFDSNGNPKLPTTVSVSGSANSNYLILGVAGIAIAFLLLRGRK